VARCHLEEARVLEAFSLGVACNCGEVGNNIGRVLADTEEALAHAREGLEHAATSDAKWHAAVRLGELELGLLKRRNRRDGMEVPKIESLKDRLSDAHHQLHHSVPTSRKLEIDYLTAALECEEKLDQADAGIPDWVGLAQRWFGRFEEITNDHGTSSPFQRGRAFYEALFYLGRLRSMIRNQPHDTTKAIDRIRTKAYRRSDDAYLDIRTPQDEQNHASAALQLLALGIYQDSYGLQERLEAAILLNAWRLRPCDQCDCPIPKPEETFETLVQARLSDAHSPDKHLTIPAKVYCHLAKVISPAANGPLGDLERGNWSGTMANCGIAPSAAVPSLIRNAVGAWLNGPAHAPDQYVRTIAQPFHDEEQIRATASSINALRRWFQYE